MLWRILAASLVAIGAGIGIFIVGQQNPTVGKAKAQAVEVTPQPLKVQAELTVRSASPEPVLPATAQPQRIVQMPAMEYVPYQPANTQVVGYTNSDRPYIPRYITPDEQRARSALLPGTYTDNRGVNYPVLERIDVRDMAAYINKAVEEEPKAPSPSATPPAAAPASPAPAETKTAAPPAEEPAKKEEPAEAPPAND